MFTLKPFLKATKPPTWTNIYGANKLMENAKVIINHRQLHNHCCMQAALHKGWLGMPSAIFLRLQGQSQGTDLAADGVDAVGQGGGSERGARRAHGGRGCPGLLLDAACVAPADAQRLAALQLHVGLPCPPALARHTHKISPLHHVPKKESKKIKTERPHT